jgi:hypothetical protein
MNEDDIYSVFEDVHDLKNQIRIINTNSYDNSIGISQCNDVIYGVNERIDKLEKKIDSIYSFLFNAKRLDLSDLDNQENI